MKKLSIFATAAALMLGLPSVANATGCIEPGVNILELADGTDVGDVTFGLTAFPAIIDVDIDTSGSSDFILLESTVDVVDEDDCDRPVNDDPAYIGPSDNPRIGTGDASSTIKSKKSANETLHEHRVPLGAIDASSDFCVTLEATLFKVDPPGPKHNKGFLKTGTAFDGPSPHKFIIADCE